MYTYVNILYGVNKELNWIELNWVKKSSMLTPNQHIQFKTSLTYDRSLTEWTKK